MDLLEARDFKNFPKDGKDQKRAARSKVLVSARTGTHHCFQTGVVADRSHRLTPFFFVLVRVDVEAHSSLD